MKSVLLVRHAKSSWGNASLSDFDRPLNERGKTDAPMMAHRLIDNKVKIDAFISSPAKRASRTARVFAKEFKEKKENIIYKTELYGADEKEFRPVIESSTGEDGGFQAAFIFQDFEEAFATVAGFPNEKVPVILDSHRLPKLIILVVGNPDEKEEGECSCKNGNE